jgi:hypothetical protein
MSQPLLTLQLLHAANLQQVEVPNLLLMQFLAQKIDSEVCNSSTTTSCVS